MEGFNPFLDDSDFNSEYYFLDAGQESENLLKRVDPYGYRPPSMPSSQKQYDPFKDAFGAVSAPIPKGQVTGQKVSSGEERALSKIGDGESEDMNFWRDNDDYKRWLVSQSINPDAIKGWQGTKLFTKYIKHKAENPTGVAWLSNELAKSVGVLGGMASAIADEIGEVPVIGDVAKPVGSVFKFISNAVDVFRAVPAAIFSDLVSGHPEEIPDSVWSALKHSFTSGTEGRYISWADGALRIMVDDLQKGMSDREFKDYIDSDEFRATKRRWQLGGLLLDMTLDPLWVASVGAMKGATVMRSMEYAKAGMVRAAGTATLAKDLPRHTMTFLDKFDEWLKFMRESKDIDQFGIGIDKVKEATDLSNKVRLEALNSIQVVENPKFWNSAAGVRTANNRAKLAEMSTEMIGDFHKNLMKAPQVYDKYLGSGLKIWRPGTRRSHLLKEIPLPTHRLANKVLDLIGQDPKAFMRWSSSRDIEKAMTRGTANVMRAVRDKGVSSDPYRAELFEDIGAALDEVDSALKGAGISANKQEVFETFMEAMLYKKGTNIRYPEEFKDIVGGVFDVGSVDKKGMVGVWNMSKRFMELEPQLMTKQAILDARKTWDSATDFILDVDKRTARGIINEYLRNGSARMAKNGKIELLTSGIDKRSFDVASLIPQEWQNEFFKYVTARVDPKFIEAARKLRGVDDLPGGERVAMLQNLHRLNYVISGVKDPRVLSKILGEEKAAQYLSMVKNNNMDIKDLWHAAHDEMRKMMMNPKHKDTIGEMMDAGEIQWQSPLMVNHLAEQGLFMKGLTQKVFDIDPAGMIDRIDRTYETLGRLDAYTGINKVAEEMGFFKHYQKVGEATTRKPDLYLGKHDWVQGKGLFSNYWVPEFLEKQTKAMSEGISRVFNPIEREIYGGVAKIPVLQIVKHYNDWWRPQVTLKSMAFHMRNGITNYVMGASEGRFNIFDRAGKDAMDLWKYGFYKAKQMDDPKKFARKSNWQKALAELEEKKIRIGDQFYSMPEAHFKLSEHGVIGNAQVHEILFDAHVESGFLKRTGHASLVKNVHNMIDKGTKGKWNLLGTNDILTMTGANASSFIEEGMARIPLFLHHTRKNGMSMAEAGKRVNDIFIDYGSLNKGQRMIKSYAIPFFTWQYKMIGVMLKKALTNPTMYSKIAQAQGNLSRMFEVDKHLASQMEEESEGIPLVTVGLDKWWSGKPMSEIDTKFVALERFIPQAVVNLVDARTPIDFFNPARYIHGISKKIIENIAPFPKFVFFESPMDINIQTRHPFERFLGERVELWGVQMSKKWKQFLTSLGAWTRILDDGISMFRENSYTGDRKHWIDFSLKHGLGVKPYDKDEIRELERMIRVINDGYRGNMRSAKLKRHNEKAVKFHYENALSMKYALDLLDFYKKYMIEIKDHDRHLEIKEEERIRELKKKRKKERKTPSFY